MREAATRIGIDLPSIALGHFLIGLCSPHSDRLRPAPTVGLAAGPRRAAVGHTRAPRLPFRRQPRVSLPGSSVVRLPQMGWVVVRLGGAPGAWSWAYAGARFRTIQVHAKDRSSMVWQVEGRLPAQQRTGRAMDERTSDQSRGSDTLAMVLYPTLFFLLMLLWVYVPA